MSQGDLPSRLAIVWSLDARGDLRGIDRKTALDLLHCIDRYLAARNGDVKKLRPPMTGFRLRCGDYRIFFKHPSDNAISITGIRHRRDAYR